MLEQGGLLTEYISTDKLHYSNFPERNRSVAGMCDAIVVVESGIKGGAVITANIANSYSRDVFAVSGEVGKKYSAGCNFLIKTFKAQLVESSKDILDAMLWNVEKTAKKGDFSEQKKLAIPLTKNEQKIYDLLVENHELEIDKLAAVCSMSTSTLANTLLEMEMNEVLIPLPGKRYKLAH
jgi:DNA processing protein